MFGTRRPISHEIGYAEKSTNCSREIVTPVARHCLAAFWDKQCPTTCDVVASTSTTSTKYVMAPCVPERTACPKSGQAVARTSDVERSINDTLPKRPY